MNVEYKDFFSFVELVQSKGYSGYSFSTSKFDENVFVCLAGGMFIRAFHLKKFLSGTARYDIYDVF